MIEIPVYVVISILSGYLCYIFVPIVKRYCVDHELFDMPGPRKIHTEPIPRLGGVAMFFAYSLGLIPGFLLLPDLWQSNVKPLVGIYIGGLIIFILGVVDDIKGVRPITKLAWEIIACLVVIAFGVRLDVVNIPFYRLVEVGWWGIPLTLIWLVAITNTVNLIDGIDGLATGVGAIIAISFLILSKIMALPLPSLLAAGIIGVTIAFLKYNYFPASIFMGDSGSLFLGYIFAVISLFWPKSFATVVMFIPILALGVPIIEVVTTFLRRLFTRQKIYIADQRHIFHILLDIGISREVTVWIFYLVSIQFALITFAITAGNRNNLFVLQFAFIILTAIVISRYLKRGKAGGK
ncbi:MAG: undecaprenyl/decaprenyl-phosphate alpha-N-acetylglucosaminyl 1-phosphate transferase [Candidatus Zixiibacteriota bacterium]|nr:MAG: undecaprenyl/decaprenyl-phosphate alpha-N-acetylglucosaminyl 1-phosphate transferase [candidate division Zixibacteria bacterium]